MSWKKNVFFSLLQEKAWKRTYYLCLKRKRIFCKSSQNFYPIEENVHPNETKPPCKRKPEWKRIFCAWKENVFFCKSRQNFTPNQRKCSPKGNKIQPEKERIFCAWKENVFFCESKQKFSPTGENFHSKETKHTWRSHQVPGSQVKYLRRERIVWYSRTIWNVEHAIQWEHFELSKVDMWKCSEETYTLIF